jgi:hypothetical protein
MAKRQGTKLKGKTQVPAPTKNYGVVIDKPDFLADLRINELCHRLHWQMMQIGGGAGVEDFYI